MQKLKFGIMMIVAMFSLQALASNHEVHNKKVDWAFDGMFGKFDKNSIRRGLKVYQEVCSACHSLKRISFRNLEDLGFSEEEVKAIAASYSIHDGPNDEGEMFDRPGRPSDYFPPVYPNDKAARAANNNALPPDQSLLIKAREDGANYIYSLLTGYSNPPKGVEVSENLHYNKYFVVGGGQIAMAEPLHHEGQVTYTDGTKATVDQMAKDVVNFLQWTAEPEMEERKVMGFKVLIFTTIFTAMFYIVKVRVWRKIK